jgi:hypothetical protein
LGAVSPKKYIYIFLRRLNSMKKKSLDEVLKEKDSIKTAINKESIKESPKAKNKKEQIEKEEGNEEQRAKDKTKKDEEIKEEGGKEQEEIETKEETKENEDFDFFVPSETFSSSSKAITPVIPKKNIEQTVDFFESDNFSSEKNQINNNQKESSNKEIYESKSSSKYSNQQNEKNYDALVKSEIERIYASSKQQGLKSQTEIIASQPPQNIAPFNSPNIIKETYTSRKVREEKEKEIREAAENQETSWFKRNNQEEYETLEWELDKKRKPNISNEELKKYR